MLTPEQTARLAELEAWENKQKAYRRNYNLGRGPVLKFKCDRCEELNDCGTMVLTYDEDHTERICYRCAYPNEETETLRIERKNVRRPPVTIKYRKEETN